MKAKIKRFLKSYILPPGVVCSLENLSAIHQLSSKDRKILRQNEPFKNKHSRERCFILATGPSVGEQDLAFLEKEVCIAVSNFVANKQFDIIKPEYYCIAPRHSPITIPQWESWMKDIEAKNPYSQFFMGLSDRQINIEQNFFQGRAHYLDFCSPRKDAFYDLTRSLTHPQSVSIMALTVAVYMGFREIYLIGCDHSWILHLNQSVHFYEEKESKMIENGYNEWSSNSSFEAELNSYLNLWQQYRTILERNPEAEIYNLAPKSLLDIFPKINIDKLAAGEV